MSEPIKAIYRPRGAATELLKSTDAEILMSGPAGTGKSLACLWKLHAAALRYPGSRSLVVRKTRASLTDSALVTFETRVLHPADRLLGGAARSGRHSYVYPNGSEIVLGGLDMVSRIMSSEYDLVYVQEAIELAEGDWEALTTRLRNGVLPYQQLLADTNPDSPRHWLKRRCDANRTRLLESRHEDNPTLWDGKEWTEKGRVYLARLDALTGARNLRLRHGRWVQAEGVVYDGWDAAIHHVDRFDIPKDWARIWSVDFGFTNPFVWQDWAVDGDRRLYLVREIYHTRRLVEDHARRILGIADASPVAVICDHDAEDRATLERYLGIATIPANKEKTPGLQAVAGRLRLHGGYPRLYILHDGLDERDASLDEAKKPCCTAEEFDSYIWDTRANRRFGEEPVKENDHGMDAMRYAVWTLDSDQSESVDSETRFDPVFVS